MKGLNSVELTVNISHANENKLKYQSKFRQTKTGLASFLSL